MNTENFIWAQLRKVENEKSAILMHGQSEIYLWYKSGELKAATEKPEGFELAFPERISYMLISRMRDLVARIPFLPLEL